MDVWGNHEIIMLAVYMVVILGIIAASYLIMSPSVSRQSHKEWQGYQEPVLLSQWKTEGGLKAV